MIVSPGKSPNSVTTPTTIAPIVAPMSGMRSSTKTIAASGARNSTPRIQSMMYDETPAIVAWMSAPPT